MYGALTGLSKKMIRQRHGPEQVTPRPLPLTPSSMYGALTGLSKKMIRQRHGPEQVLSLSLANTYLLS